MGIFKGIWIKNVTSDVLRSIAKYLWYCKIILSMCLHKAKHSSCVPLVYFCSEIWGRGKWMTLMCVQALKLCFTLFLLCNQFSQEFVSHSGVMHLLPEPGLARTLGEFHYSFLEGACSVIMYSPSVFLGIPYFQGKRQCKNHFEEHIMGKKRIFLERLCRRLIPSQLDDFHREKC